MAEKRKKLAPAKDKLDEMGIEAVCERIADGWPLHRIASEAGVSKGTLITWLGGANLDHYTRAKEAQADKFAEEIIAIADEESTTVKGGDDGPVEVVFDSTAVQRNRLRVDARKWLASKMYPKRYGDRQALDVEAKVTMRTLDQELSDLNAQRNTASGPQVA